MVFSCEPFLEMEGEADRLGAIKKKKRKKEEKTWRDFG